MSQFAAEKSNTPAILKIAVSVPAAECVDALRPQHDGDAHGEAHNGEAHRHVDACASAASMQNGLQCLYVLACWTNGEDNCMSWHC